jgi:hypothetical protein
VSIRRLAPLLLAVGLLTPIAPRPATAADGSGGQVKVVIDSTIIESPGGGGAWTMEYVVTATGSYDGTTGGGNGDGTYATLSGTATINDGTATLQAGTGAPFAFSYTNGAYPSLVTHYEPPSESYLVSAGGHSTTVSLSSWYPAWTLFHPTASLTGLQLTPGTGDVLATAHLTGLQTQESVTFQEDTTVTVTKLCPSGKPVATVSFSSGDAPAVGSTFCGGDRVRTGHNGRVEIVMGDGSVVRVGPDSDVDVGEGSSEGGGRDLSLELVLGDIWEAVGGTGGPIECHCVAGVRGRVPAGDRASTDDALRGSATPGASVTLGIDAAGSGIFHVVSGTGTASWKGQVLKVPAGWSAKVVAGRLTLVTDWPAADRALLDPSALPPGVRLKLTKRLRAGTKPRLKLTLDQRARIDIAITKATKAKKKAEPVIHKAVTEAAGTHVVKLPKALGGGSYVVTVTATAGGRVTVTQTRLKVLKAR